MYVVPSNSEHNGTLKNFCRVTVRARTCIFMVHKDKKLIINQGSPQKNFHLCKTYMYIIRAKYFVVIGFFKYVHVHV